VEDLLTLKIKYLDDTQPRIKLPREGDIGIDIYAAEYKFIEVGKEALISTGIKIELPAGYWGQLLDRSSVSAYCHTLAGVIDEKFRGEVKIRLFCHSANCTKPFECKFLSADIRNYQTGYEVYKGSKIAQLVIRKSYNDKLQIEEVDELSTTERGTGGFGSTGS
jgi:dUTP pyrophosphatase